MTHFEKLGECHILFLSFIDNLFDEILPRPQIYPALVEVLTLVVPVCVPIHGRLNVITPLLKSQPHRGESESSELYDSPRI